jgi:hypothetical protein
VASERDAARSAQEQALAEREALAQAADRLQSQHAHEMATRGAALVMRNAAIGSSGRRHAGWPQRLLAIMIVIAVIVALLLVLKIV